MRPSGLALWYSIADCESGKLMTSSLRMKHHRELRDILADVLGDTLVGEDDAAYL